MSVLGLIMFSFPHTEVCDCTVSLSEIDKYTLLLRQRLYSRKKSLQKPNLLKNHKCLCTHQGVYQKDKIKGVLRYELQNDITNVENVQMSLKATSKVNFPGITPTWYASTWTSRWGQLV